MQAQKNHTLELLKLFASYMVVFIHVTFGGWLGVAAETVARFAVPFFFLIAGFYSYRITTDSIRKRIRNIGTLLILATVAYTLFNVLLLWFVDGPTGIATYFGHYTHADAFVKLLVFNTPRSADHLWYLFAALYVYVIFYVVTARRVSERWIFAVSLALLGLHLALGEGLSAMGLAVPPYIVRNFALTGIPFFALGLLAKKQEHKLRTLPTAVLLATAAIGVAAALFSRRFVGKNEVYVGSLLLVFALVGVFVKYAHVRYPTVLTALSGCSTYIYIFHMMVAMVLVKGYEILGFDPSSLVLTNLHPLLVCIGSTIVAYLMVRIVDKCKAHRHS